MSIKIEDRIMKSYLRFLSRNKLYTAIMAVGLSVSLAFVIIMSCYVWQNLSVSRFYPDADRIYCVGNKGTTYSSFNLGKMLDDRFPEVEMSATVMNRASRFSTRDVLIEQSFFMGVDPDFFEMFPTRFVYGSKEAFNDFGNVIITRSLADRLGGEKALGMQLHDEFMMQDYIIGAVVEGFEDTVFGNVEVIINTRSPRFDRSRSEHLGISSSGMFTFIRTSEETDIAALQKKVEDMYAETVDNNSDGECFSFTRLDKLYLADTNDGKSGLKKGNKGLMTAFGIIVIFLLVSAVFNYINLSTALTGKRSKETATRMLLGKTKKEILRTNLAESFGFMFLCMCMAFLIAHLCIPLVNRLLNSPIPIEMKFSQGYIFMYLAIMGISAIFCAIAPALLSLKFEPLDIIRGSFRYSSKRIFSKVFIIVQNCIAVIMIAVSLTMQMQIKHMTDMPLNARVEGLYMARTNSEEIIDTLSKLPYLGKIGRAEGRPGQSYMRLGVPVNEDRTRTLTFNMCNCDSTAFHLFEFKVVKNYGLPGNVGIWLTESAFRALELDEAAPVLPESLKWYCNNPVVAGIIEDVMFSSAINLNPDHLGLVNLIPESQIRPSVGIVAEVINLTRENIKELDALCEAETRKVFGPSAPMMSGYIPELMSREYEDIRNQMKMVNIFMLIAIMLSALGQIAISTYYANEKSKDIGIRKVFGGTVESESRRTVWEYMLYCIIAAFIAIPVSVLICGRYLETFIYRMPSKPWIYLAAALAVLITSLASVLWQTLRAARTNPAEVLKKE